LPDGIFKPKIPVWVNFGVSCNERCYGELFYFTAFSYILSQFIIFCGYLGIFSPFLYVVPRKIWQPWPTLLCAKRAFSTVGKYIPTYVGTHRQGCQMVHFHTKNPMLPMFLFFKKFRQKIGVLDSKQS
jgi:hypothetical protein